MFRLACRLFPQVSSQKELGLVGAYTTAPLSAKTHSALLSFCRVLADDLLRRYSLTKRVCEFISRHTSVTILNNKVVRPKINRFRQDCHSDSEFGFKELLLDFGNPNLDFDTRVGIGKPNLDFMSPCLLTLG